jgi:small nuclear ribonucleoprotein G
MAPKFQKGPDLKRFMDKRLQFSLNGNRKVIGTLRGYDAFLNVVLEEAEDAADGKNIGTIVIRGNSIIQFEGLERVAAA